MKKKLIFVIFLGVLLIGCKARKNQAYVKKRNAAVVVKKETPKRYISDGLYPLPKDLGRFVTIEFSSIAGYIDTFSEIAQYEMKAFGIPASITLAQGLLESGFGKGVLARKTNNHFGIKCHTGWQGDYDFHDDDEKGECFRKYNHPMYSFRDHSHFLTSRSRYASLFELKSDDYKSWAKGLKKAGYATDKHYPQKLIQLIEKYKLYTYDKGIGSKKVVKRQPLKIAAVKQQNRTYLVQRGDTLYSISKKYAVTITELKKWNMMLDNLLITGQELIVKFKKVK